MMGWIGKFLKDIAGTRVLIVGDLMLDRYLWGSVSRISPEAPVPIMRLGAVDNRVGGALNVAKNMRQLGCKPMVAGVVGDDAYGQTLREIAAKVGIDCSGIVTDADRPTTAKTRVIAGHQHLLRVDDEFTDDLERAVEDELISRVRKLLVDLRPDAVVLQDYNKGVLTSTSIAACIGMATGSGVPVFVDPKHANFYSYIQATLIKPNLSELRAALPFTISVADQDLKRASDHVRGRLGVEVNCFTLSEHGIFIDKGNTARIFPTRPREVVDVCGAGDAVLSALTLAHLVGLEHEQMGHLANTVGGLVCEQVGVAPISIDMLQEELVDVSNL